MLLSRIAEKTKNILFFRTFVGELLTAFYSIFIHLRFSFNNRMRDNDKEKMRFYLVKHCHIVEKGLALPAPRLGFGEPKIIDLIKNAREYERLHGKDDVTEMLRDMLREYLTFHQQRSYSLPPEFKVLITRFNAEDRPNQKGGLKELRKEQWGSWSLEKYDHFVSCRHSVRDFSDTPVDDDRIHEIVRASINTPSVCNRQGWTVHYYRDKKTIQRLLAFQNGNTGFTECIDKLLIITGSAKAFTRYEHNQLFIDGGLLSMNVMLALHAEGLGSCPLNTCMPFYKESAVKKAAGINRHERLIMMIAVGHLKDKFFVAQSGKYKLDQVLREH